MMISKDLKKYICIVNVKMSLRYHAHEREQIILCIFSLFVCVWGGGSSFFRLVVWFCLSLSFLSLFSFFPQNILVFLGM